MSEKGGGVMSAAAPRAPIVHLRFHWKCHSCLNEQTVVAAPEETCDGLWERYVEGHAIMCEMCPKFVPEIQRLEDEYIYAMGPA
jgi:phage terminase large subunit GpA-like protein